MKRSVLSIGAVACIGIMLSCGSDTSESSATAALLVEDICMEQKWMDDGNSQNLTCTAKEVFIEEDSEGNKIISTEIVDGDGCEFQGDTATVNIIADIHFNADRFDIGIYSALDGGDALNGTCAVDVLDPNAPPPGLDADGDACGDVDVPGGGGTFTDFEFQTLTLLCEDQDFDGFLDFGTCFSWRTKGSNEVCTGPDDIFPGSPSKCFCERVNIDVPIPPAELLVTKEANPASLLEPSGDVTYTVTVTNTAIVPGNDVTLNSLIDDPFGDITMVQGDVKSTTCAVPQTLTQGGGAYECTFTATVSGNGGDNVPDTVTASGTDALGNDVVGSAMAEVIIIDVPPAARLTKTATMATVTYEVVVFNDSMAESLSLDALIDDPFGDITMVQGDVLSTTCAVPQTIAVGGSYTCQFDAKVSTSPHIDTVTGTVSDNDGNSIMRSDSASVTFE